MRGQRKEYSGRQREMRADGRMEGSGRRSEDIAWRTEGRGREVESGRTEDYVRVGHNF